MRRHHTLTKSGRRRRGMQTMLFFKVFSCDIRYHCWKYLCLTILQYNILKSDIANDLNVLDLYNWDVDDFFFTRLILTLIVKTLVHRKILAEYSGYYFKLTCLRYDLAIFYFNV